MTDPGTHPAHPGHYDSHYGGLTKREWYAGLALQGLLANPPDNLYAMAQARGTTREQVAASFALAYADALLAELAKGGGT